MNEYEGELPPMPPADFHIQEPPQPRDYSNVPTFIHSHSDTQMDAYARQCVAYYIAKQAKAAVVPEGWKLVAVNPAFDDLMFWLDRCERKGHLENCSDLCEPWSMFEYEHIAAAPAQEGK